MEHARPWEKRRFIHFFWFAGGLVLLFSPVLWKLFRYSLQESFYSHILLIPFVCAYLVWQEKARLPHPAEQTNPVWLLPGLCGAGILGGYLLAQFSGRSFTVNDSLTWTVLPFWLLFVSGMGFLMGTEFLRRLAFPICFAVFIVPFPESLTNFLEIASQHASAETYSWLMALSGATYFRDGLVFLLPGWELQVAQECSGIRSSFVLFLTSLIAAQMFLQTRWKQCLIAFIVFPLGIARNAFRIYTLSMLTTYVNPDIIHSPLHHRGGPIFFALSLIPFLFLLILLRRSEARRSG